GCSDSHRVARRADCANRLRQVAMALQSYSSQNDEALPVGIYKGSRMTAQTALLPYLEAVTVYKMFNPSLPADRNSKGATVPIPIFNCPADNPSGTYQSPGGGTYARSNSVFCFGSDTLDPKVERKRGALRVNTPSGFFSIMIDGTPNTAMVCE